MIEFNFNSESKTLTCKFLDRMDTPNSHEAIKQVNEKLEEIPGKEPNTEDLKLDSIKVVFDLKGVHYISSSFLKLCILTAKKVDTGCFSIINTDPRTMKVFKISRLDEMLNVT